MGKCGSVGVDGRCHRTGILELPLAGKLWVCAPKTLQEQQAGGNVAPYCYMEGDTSKKFPILSLGTCEQKLRNSLTQRSERQESVG